MVSLFSEKFRDAMHANYNVDPDKTMVVYNGFDRDAWQFMVKGCLPEPSGRFIVSYVGSDITFEAGSGRDPGELIRAVSGSTNANRFTLNLVGCKNEPPIGQYPDTLASINYLPLVSHEESLQYLIDSDVVVVLSSDEVPSDFTVTGKLFDCIRSGAVILGISNSMEIDYIKIIEKKGLVLAAITTHWTYRKSLMGYTKSGLKRASSGRKLKTLIVIPEPGKTLSLLIK